jgi:hypothetical protein
MTRARSGWTQVATATLGIITVGAFGSATLLAVVGFAGGGLLGTELGSMATLAVLGLAVLAATYGAVAGIGAVGVWQGRDWGRVIGLLVGGVAILGAVVARMSNGWHDALWAAAALGAALVTALLVDRPVEPRS